MPLVENQKVYPLSEQASSVLDVMRIEIQRLGVEVCTDTKVVDIKQQGNKWQIKAEHKEEGTKQYQVDEVIVATGGLAGVTADYTIYDILKRLGHHVVPTFPTLVHIVSSSKYCKMMQGTRVKGEISIYKKDTLARKEKGEVLFTEDGLSGPPVFQLSRIAAECEAKKIPCYVELDFYPQISVEEMIGMFYDRIA